MAPAANLKNTERLQGAVRRTVVLVGGDRKALGLRKFRYGDCGRLPGGEPPGGDALVRSGMAMLPSGAHAMDDEGDPISSGMPVSALITYGPAKCTRRYGCPLVLWQQPGGELASRGWFGGWLSPTCMHVLRAQRPHHADNSDGEGWLGCCSTLRFRQQRCKLRPASSHRHVQAIRRKQSGSNQAAMFSASQW